MLYETNSNDQMGTLSEKERIIYVTVRDRSGPASESISVAAVPCLELWRETLDQTKVKHFHVTCSMDINIVDRSTLMEMCSLM
jgi:hypothetical protein